MRDSASSAELEAAGEEQRTLDPWRDNALTMTEATESYDGPWEWSLGSFAKTAQGLQLTFGRAINEEELAEWKAAADFVRTLASGSTYPQALSAIQTLGDAVARLAAKPEADRSTVEVEGLAPSFHQVTRLVDRAAGRTLSEIDGFPISSDDAARVRGRCVGRAGDDSLRRCRALAGASAPPSVALEPGAEGETHLLLTEDGTDAVMLLHRAASAIQLMHAERLAGLAEQVHEAGTLLRRATAEVLEGPPTLIRHRPFIEGESPDTRSVSFEDLALDRIEPLAHLIGQAQRLLQVAADGGGAPPESKSAMDDTEQSDVAESQESKTEESEDDDQPLIETGTIDVIALLHEMESLGEELEHAWSKALDAVLDDDTLEGARARWGSLLQALGHEAEAGSKQALAIGLDALLGGELLAASPEVVELDPDPDQGFKQAEVAYIFAFEPLVAAIQGLLRHPIERTTISRAHGFSREHLWDSGAFAAVRDRAQFAAAIEAERVEARARAAGLASEEDDVRAGGEFQKLRFAEAALSRGDPEAAILHLSHFFDRLDEAQIDPARLEAASGRIGLLRTAATRLEDGLPLTTATVVARCGLLAAALLLAPPERLAHLQGSVGEPEDQA